MERHEGIFRGYMEVEKTIICIDKKIPAYLYERACWYFQINPMLKDLM